MDSALILKIKVDKKETIIEPVDYLSESEIVNKIISKNDLNSLGKIFSLIGISEIPYALELEYTKELVSFMNTHIATSEGFSYTGKLEEIVPCYNAMLLTAYCQLRLGTSKEAQASLNWIKKYQVFNREDKTKWQHNGICKFGGCMNNVPCYIGIGKNVKALLTYQEIVTRQDEEVNKLIKNGLDYMLQHQLFLRLSENKPISAHITDNVFPASYVLSLTDLMYIVYQGHLKQHEKVQPLLKLLDSKRTNQGGFKIDYIYQYQGYTAFDNRRKDSEWLSYLYDKWLK